MSIFQLGEEIIFPDPRLAEPEGLLAFGGDLKPERILLAYQMGIFPWFSDNQPILWWSPDPRMILYPNRFHISKTLRRKLRSSGYFVQFDQNFSTVIQNCANTPRKGEQGTWITEDMIEAYLDLHQKGFAHSVEVYAEEKLIGGLYGISIGNGFFGESMFSFETDASKIAFAYLARVLENWNFEVIDCQLPTNHLKSLGAEEITRENFLSVLEEVNHHNTKRGSWNKTALETIKKISF